MGRGFPCPAALRLFALLATLLAARSYAVFTTNSSAPEPTPPAAVAAMDQPPPQVGGAPRSNESSTAGTVPLLPAAPPELGAVPTPLPGRDSDGAASYIVILQPVAELQDLLDVCNHSTASKWAYHFGVPTTSAPRSASWACRAHVGGLCRRMFVKGGLRGFSGRFRPSQIAALGTEPPPPPPLYSSYSFPSRFEHHQPSSVRLILLATCHLGMSVTFVSLRL